MAFRGSQLSCARTRNVARPGPVRAALGKRRLANGQTAASAKNSRSGPRPRRREAKPNWRERKKTSNLSWNWIFVGAIPRARKSTTFAGIAFPRGAAGRQPGWRERNRCTGVRLDARPGQGRARAGVRRSRTAASAIDAAAPTGARRLCGAPAQACGAAKLPRAQKTRAKVVQLLLELLFCWRNSASAKVYNFRWNCFFAGAIPRAQKSCNFC